MIKVAFFDTKPYDQYWFTKINNDQFHIVYFEHKLNADTAQLTKGYDAVVVFVNDKLDEDVISVLAENKVKLIALRCAGYNNVDFKAAYGKINVVRVPGYSPYAVAEHAAALLLCLNRKIHRAYNRTREHNFNINGLTGFDLHGKTAGVIGTGKIGQVFISICKGFGMKVIAYDPYPNKNLPIDYVELDELFTQSDVISLHCPLSDGTYHILNKDSFDKMKSGVVILNTSRGALIDSEALLKALQSEKVGAAGLDVYEEEAELFFEDLSNEIIKDEVLSLLNSLPNVIITSHQAFLTNEALSNIAQTTIDNMSAFFEGGKLDNEVCYYCQQGGAKPDCKKAINGRCF